MFLSTGLGLGWIGIREERVCYKAASDGSFALIRFDSRDVCDNGEICQLHFLLMMGERVGMCVLDGMKDLRIGE